MKHWIVSIFQPLIRPIFRGKPKAPVEFEVKSDFSLDSEGYAQIEKIAFEAYNERGCLREVVERFKERIGLYTERILAAQICRTSENRCYCEEHDIYLSGQRLGTRKNSTRRHETKILG